MAKFRNFDAAWAEQTGECPSVQVFGKVYQLPPRMPAVVIFEGKRLSKLESGADVPVESVERMLVGLFGRETLDQWLESQIDFDQLGEVMRWAMAAYAGQADADEDPDLGESTAPKTGRKPAGSAPVSTTS